MKKFSERSTYVALCSVLVLIFFTAGIVIGGLGKISDPGVYTGPSPVQTSILVTPQSCRDAVTAADAGFAIVVNILSAVSVGDYAEVETLNTQIGPTLTPYRVAKEKCLAPQSK